MRKNSIVVKRKTLSGIKTQHDALEYLRQTYPDTFKDPDVRDLAIMVVMELKDELVKMSPLQRLSTVSAVIGMMYKMGTAAIKATRTRPEDADAIINEELKPKSMARICVEAYIKEKEQAGESLT